jgi:hypothetical protein
VVRTHPNPKTDIWVTREEKDNAEAQRALRFAEEKYSKVGMGT